MKRTWPFVRFVLMNKRLYLSNLIMQLFRSGIPLLPALIVRVVFDRLDARNSDIWLLLALLAGVALARVTALLSTVALNATCSAKVQTSLIWRAAGRLLARPGAEVAPFAVGGTITRFMLDGSTIAEMMMFTPTVVGAGVEALVAVGVMLAISPLITGVVLVPLIAVGVLMNLLSTRIRELHRHSQRAAADVGAFLREAFNAVQPIQLANAQPHVIARLAELNEQRRKTSVQSLFFTNVFLVSVWAGISNLCTGLVLLLAAHGFTQGTFTAGDLALFVAYIGWVSDFVTLFGQNLAQHRQAGISLRRIAEAVPDTKVTDLVVRDRARPVQEARPAERVPFDGLAVRGLTYLYPSGRGIEDVDLDVAPGDFVVVCGRVGAGKTTLLRTLLGMLPAQAGSVSWNGTPVPDPAALFGPLRTAYTPQIPHLFNDSIHNNIVLNADTGDQEVARAAHLALLEPDLADFASGLDTIVGQKGTQVSGGQAQRIAVARMLSRQCDLLVLDDPSSALDIATERQLCRNLRRNVAGTCLLASNRRPALQHATKIVLLADGHAITTGSMPELMESCPEFQAIYGFGLDAGPNGEVRT